MGVPLAAAAPTSGDLEAQQPPHGGHPAKLLHGLGEPKLPLVAQLLHRRHGSCAAAVLRIELQDRRLHIVKVLPIAPGLALVLELPAHPLRHLPRAAVRRDGLLQISPFRGSQVRPGRHLRAAALPKHAHQLCLQHQEALHHVDAPRADGSEAQRLPPRGLHRASGVHLLRARLEGAQVGRQVLKDQALHHRLPPAAAIDGRTWLRHPHLHRKLEVGSIGRLLLVAPLLQHPLALVQRQAALHLPELNLLEGLLDDVNLRLRPQRHIRQRPQRDLSESDDAIRRRLKGERLTGLQVGHDAGQRRVVRQQLPYRAGRGINVHRGEDAAADAVARVQPPRVELDHVLHPRGAVRGRRGAVPPSGLLLLSHIAVILWWLCSRCRSRC
mmetsp:Transcript_31437/g.80578  ORF Transcript_31437/g.80578 Transcript_31437/m.80578 type:complete len:384 (-) Transcript_31437:119-1270(-)